MPWTHATTTTGRHGKEKYKNKQSNKLNNQSGIAPSKEDHLGRHNSHSSCFYQVLPLTWKKFDWKLVSLM